MSLQKRFTSPYIWCVLLILFYSPDASLGFTIHPRRSCKNIYSTTSSLKESGDDKGGLNWDYDLWKEFDLRTRAKSNLQSLQGEQSVGGKLSIGQRIKLWLITTRVKLTPKESFLIKDWTLQNSLITINILLFLYQIQTSTLRRASLWQKIQQPTKSALAMDFLYMGRLAEKQPHRFITSGFLHGSALHLLCNLQSWYSGIPGWLESAGGKSRYLTVFLMSIIGGNLSHSIFTANGPLVPAVGASGGICGLLGYTWIVLREMKTLPANRYSRHVMKYMLQLIIYGALIPRVSNAAHIGGFATGAILGYFVGPRFRKSYLANRWGNDDYIKFAPDARMNPGLRSLIGPNLVLLPNSRIPLYSLAVGLAIFLVLDPNPAYRAIPQAIYTCLLQPGRLSGLWYYRR